MQIHSKKCLYQQELRSLFSQLTGTKPTPAVVGTDSWHFKILDKGSYRQSVWGTTLFSFPSWVQRTQEPGTFWRLGHQTSDEVFSVA